MTEKRRTNWGLRELEELVCGMESHHSVLSSRFSQDVSNHQKNMCMEEIVVSVNAVGGADRSKEEILRKWTDLKSRTKKKEQERRKASGMSGQGPVKKSLELNEIDLKVLNLLPKVIVYGIDGGMETGEKGSQKRKSTDEKENNEALKVPRTEENNEAPMVPRTEDPLEHDNGMSPENRDCDNPRDNQRIKTKKSSVCHCSDDIIQIQREILEESRKRNLILTALNSNLTRIIDNKIESDFIESLFKA